MDATYTRRAFNRRAAGWLSLGGLMLAGCGPTQEDIDAARADIQKLDKRLTAIDGGKAPAKTTAKTSSAHSAAKPGDAAHDAPHWSYEGKTGPAEWGNLDPTNGACSTGAGQSPIDLGPTQPGVGGRTLIKWQPAGLTVVNNGHTIQADVEKGSLIEIDGQPFDLVQFHFHTPSEHTLNGKPFAMETHFVHKNKDGALAVVGVLHSVGGEAPALTPILGAMPKKADEKKPLPKMDLAALLPRERAMFRYAGSLTTPPCSEGVRWQVFQSPTTVSDAQLRAFQELYKNNARPVQPLKARDVLKESA